MSTELTYGIENRGEFYSHHYLEALLEGDLKPLLARWADAEKGTPPVRQPPKVLNGLAGAYFQARAEASDVGAHAPEVAWQVAHGFHARLLDALGYSREPAAVALEDGKSVPVLHEVRRGGKAYLWILEAAFPAEADGDPMDGVPLPAQLPAGHDEAELATMSWRELLDARIFRKEDAPTWVLFLGGSEAVLTHAFKWPRGQAIAFDLDALYARRQATAFRAMAGLLHADALCPAEGTPLHDQLDENSHKHAFAVSTDLREGAQQAIELLGNEAIRYLRETRKKGVFGSSDSAESIDPKQLTRECLLWLYRLIFLFYVESRSEELGVAPMKSTAYRMGYSLESLRALETVPLTTPQAQNGTYIDASLRQLFSLVNDGHPKDQQMALAVGIDAVAFRIHGLKSRLFDDGETPILKKVQFRNAVLQRVVELLSLSREGKHKSRGRISYASLGINQLGAVYEGLLSYTGFFAKEDLIEVANAKENGKPDARTFFVPARDRELYEDDELVRDETGARRQYPKGTFLFRLAGRDREKSASYYTPEVLTRCLVKYTLRERIGVNEDDPNWVTADELLELTICEPAMGSGAFLNEVVNQLAEAYLQRKQAELRKDDPEHSGIPADRYLRELQRVKARIAANQCYGVDLNPLAAELGKVSLWLNVLRAGAPAPFFDARIATGNSLVGARRATYELSQLHKTSKKAGPGWLDLPPKPIEGQRPKGAVYHFLLPASGMAAFDGDKVVKGLMPDEVGKIKAWRKALKANWSNEEKARLERLSEVVDRLWAEHAANREAALAECDQRQPVWPEPEPPMRSRSDEEHLAKGWAAQQKRNGAGRRLKAVMDLWSALWFWPVREAELLPSRREWLDDLELLLIGKPRGDLATAVDHQARRVWLLPDIATQRGFVHWEWSFPEVFAGGGFDVVVGNPPWVKLTWNLASFACTLDPRLGIRGLKTAAIEKAALPLLREEKWAVLMLNEMVTESGQISFVGARTNYPEVQGSQPNTYKNFLPLSWRILSDHGMCGVYHQPGLITESKGVALRAALTRRLASIALFRNELNLFEGILHTRPYCFTISRGNAFGSVSFWMLSNLVHPRQIDESFDHDGLGPVPPLKEGGSWSTRGHAMRILRFDRNALQATARVFDPGAPAVGSKIPSLHSRLDLESIRQIATCESQFSDQIADWFTTEHFHQTNAERAGVIKNTTTQPSSAADWILCGPNVYVGTAAFKNPRRPCRSHLDYDTVDLSVVATDFLPGSTFAYVAPCEKRGKVHPHWRGTEVTEYARWVTRKMQDPQAERMLSSAVLPIGAAHIGSVFSAAHVDPAKVVFLCGLAASMPFDFLNKALGKTNFSASTLSALPWPTRAHQPILVRAARLSLFSIHYKAVWEAVYNSRFGEDSFTKKDDRLQSWVVGPEWDWRAPIRDAYSRRQAMVELDALVAISLGLSPEQIAAMYVSAAPILIQNEHSTYYDRRGQIVYSSNRGTPDVGVKRAQWEEIRGQQLDRMTYAGIDPLPDWAHDALGPYVPPFDRCDREADMHQAYAEFVRRGVGSDT